MVRIVIERQYYREQFDDWLAAGTFVHKSKSYPWSAQNNNCGFGWEIEPVSEGDWDEVGEDELGDIVPLIETCLQGHRTEYAFSLSS